MKSFLTLRPTIRRLAAGCALGLVSTVTFAALTDIATEPVTQVSTNPVKPNIMFILDDSGSMAWSHMPDEAADAGSTVIFTYGFYGLRSSQCNRVYYNPAFTYNPPVKADGTSYANASFTSAWTDGFAGSGSVNLSTSFKAGDSSNTGDGTGSAAYYYVYTGLQTADSQKNYNDSTTTFYKECASANGVAPGNAVFTKKTVSSTSGPGSTDERQNFANWYSYYRNRMLTMKSAVGLAFKAIDDRYRVGFTTINYTGTDTTNAKFLSINDFSTAQKSSWYTKLYNISPSGSTPLRTSLTKVGRIYAGKIGDDPVQYSCQQNFAFLSTDGFWNTGTGSKEDGSTPVGNQDGPGTARPYYDGAKSLTNRTTTTSTKVYFLRRNSCSSSRRQTMVRTDVTTLTEQIDDSSGAIIYSMTNTVPGVASVYDATCIASSSSVPPSTSTPPVVTTTSSSTGGSSDSLADVAMYYYKTDLRPGVPDSAGCKTGATLPDGTKADVCKNNVSTAGNDNANWQHMTTFTMGLGVNGQLNYSDTYETDTAGDFFAVKNGTKDWPVPGLSGSEGLFTNVDDLWHAAVNGRGTYFNAKNPQAVSVALGKFFASIQVKQAAGAAAATSNLEPVAGDNFAFVANYRTVKWDGNVNAREIDLTTGAIKPDVQWSARDLLLTLVAATTDSRKIYMFSSAGSSKLQDFAPANFTAAQKTAWFNPTLLFQYTTLTAAQQANATSDRMINYLRGQRGYEATGANAVDSQVFRAREYILGDIVNGKPVYVRTPPFSYGDTGYASFKTSNAVQNRPGVVYIAANDGMLHAFDGTTGVEKWAYVPSAVIPNMYRLASTDYDTNHRYFVDGSPAVGDIADSSNNWKTMLVGGLNAGGRQYYALDITDPNNPKGMWEFTNANLGYTFGNPVITKNSAGKWVVLISSGYNNVTPGDGVGRLFVLDAQTGTLLDTISTGVGDLTTPSGLGKLSTFVQNGLTNNTSERVYAGDLLGNVWRFDINDTIPPAGKDAFLMATLKSSSGAIQPITTRIEVGEFDDKTLLFVGTGRLLARNDTLDTSQQSLYAIYDNKVMNAAYGNPRTSACGFVKQTISVLSEVQRSISQNPVDFSTKCGWYVDFNPANDSPGERINVEPILQLGILSVVTNIPEASACTAGGTSFLYFVDAATGGRITNDAGNLISNSLSVGQVIYRLPDGRVVSTITTADDKQLTRETPEPPGGGSGGGKRVYWRELFTK